MIRVLLLAAAAALLAAGCASAPGPAERMDGWWELEHGRAPPPLLALIARPPPLRAGHADALRTTLIGLIHEGRRHIEYCGPHRYVGFLNGEGFEDVIELLFTPGRVTLTNEVGLLRRIALDGRAARAPQIETPTGTSAGRWEGEVLVVETQGLMATARFPLPVEGLPHLGAGARVTERIALVEPDVLEIRATLTAPELLREPFEITTRYLRARDHVPLERNECLPDDRLIDRQSGGTRFDLTPPPDLPPPPP
jgi:hypothetical protein